MREIKFRAWDKEIRDIFVPTCVPLFEPSKYILMQYTGLKDKNGVGIYEGDIVQNLRGKKNKVYWEQDILAWNCETFSVNGRKGYLMLSDLDSVATLEVIGNIYEHPHLLEVK